MSQTEWDAFYLNCARVYSEKSKDPSTKVGCILTFENRQISQGYNGFSRGIDDARWLRLANRDTKLRLTIHAENNAFLFLGPQRVDTCYTFPVPVCAHCFSQGLQLGIRRFVSPPPTKDWISRWGDDIVLVESISKEIGVSVEYV